MPANHHDVTAQAGHHAILFTRPPRWEQAARGGTSPFRACSRRRISCGRRRRVSSRSTRSASTMQGKVTCSQAMFASIHSPSTLSSMVPSSRKKKSGEAPRNSSAATAPFPRMCRGLIGDRLFDGCGPVDGVLAPLAGVPMSVQVRSIRTEMRAAVLPAPVERRCMGVYPVRRERWQSLSFLDFLSLERMIRIHETHKAAHRSGFRKKVGNQLPEFYYGPIGRSAE